MARALNNVLLHCKELPNRTQALSIFQNGKKCLESRDEDIAGAWKTLLLELLPLLSPETCKIYLKELIDEGGMKISMPNRIWLINVMGAVSGLIDEETFNTVVFKKIKLFAQDVDADVRVCMCTALKQVVKSIK